MHFKRYFTKDIHPYNEVTWIRTTAEIKGSGFKQENVEFPDFYSQNAINIIASKYFAGKIGTSEREYSLKQLIIRVVGTNVQWGFLQGYFELTKKEAEKFAIDFIGEDQVLDPVRYNYGLYKQIYNSFENAKIYSDELTHMLLHQTFSFNSPVWFNMGNPYSKPQASACFIVSAEDTMESIAENAATEMQIFRLGSGAGTNRSKLRSSREFIGGGGKASGPNSFMKIYDAVANVTKSGGKSRRAAKMEILNVDHGDIKEFIWQKKIEEDKAKALIKAGYSDKFNDVNGAYGSVFFQNSNQSVRVTDAFMQAVEKDEDWALIERIPEKSRLSWIGDEKHTSQGIFYINNIGSYKFDDGLYTKVIEWVKAQDLFREITQCAWETGDPGIQFHDTINFWYTCKASGAIEASNPCSEYMFLDDTSCNLASLNLIKFYKDDKFQIDSFQQAVRIGITAMDIWIDYAHYPTEKIAQETKKYRTLGLGYTNLGALLLRMGFAYDSDQGRNIAAAITSLMHATAYNQSRNLAIELSPFKVWSSNSKDVVQILKQHRDAIEKLHARVKGNEIEETVSSALMQMESCVNGPVRNAQVTVLAPTGTISFMMDAETTGIEPVLALTSYKKLVGGGTVKLTIPSAEMALHKLGVSSGTDLNEESIIRVLDPKYHSVFATSLSIENPIPWEAHIKMMAAVQPFLSGAISKTVNMPNSATVDDVENAYMMAWKNGLKSIAIYRDGCKASQPLNIKEEKPNTNELLKYLDEFGNTQGKTTPDNPKHAVLSNGRPKPVRKKMADQADAIRHKFSVGGHEGYLHVGLFDNNEPGEVFVKISKEGSTISGLFDSWALLFSLLLQYGCPLRDIVEKLKHIKFEPQGITNNQQIRFASSLVDYIAKWLENEFLNDDDEITTDYHKNQLTKDDIEVKVIEKKNYDGPPCSKCGTLTQKSGSCYTCPECGETTGCG